jgi:hypothetical protein
MPEIRSLVSSACCHSKSENESRPDYNLSVKEVYTDVVYFLLTTTQRLDVICDSIHYPYQASSIFLPSFVPDWSAMPATLPLRFRYEYSTSGMSKAEFRFVDERRNKLEISAIPINTVDRESAALGTLCMLPTSSQRFYTGGVESSVASRARPRRTCSAP